MHGEDSAVPGRGSALTRRRLLIGSAAAGAGAAIANRARRAAASPTAAVPGAARSQDATVLVVAFTSNDAQKVKPLLDEYGAANNVQFDIRQAPYDPMYAELALNLTGDTGFYDVVSMDDPWIPQFAGGEFIQNLSELLGRRGETFGDFIPELLALGDFPPGSGLRGIPWVGNVQVFAWRTDVLETMGLPVPKTWDEVLTSAQAITAGRGDSGPYGIGLRGVPGNAATTSFLPILRGHGVDIFAADSWEPQLTTPQASQAMTTHLALAKLAPPGVDRVDHDANGRNMASGMTAMSADIWPDLLLKLFDPNQSQVAGKIAVGPQPAQPGVEPATMTGNWLLGIPTASAHPDAAIDFILWFTAPEQQKRLLLQHNIPATRFSVLQDPEAVARLPFLEGLLAAGRNARPRPRTPLYPQVEVILGLYLAEAIAGRITGEEALAKANGDIRALMVRNGEL